MSDDRNWEDQPRRVMGAAIVGSFSSTDGDIVEVRHGDAGGFFVTTGSLFGSQTLECRDAEIALRVVLMVGRGRRKGGRKVPDGATLLDSEKR